MAHSSQLQSSYKSHPSTFGPSSSSTSSAASLPPTKNDFLSREHCPCVRFTDTSMSCRQRILQGNLCESCRWKDATEQSIMNCEMFLQREIGSMAHEDTNVSAVSVRGTGCHQRHNCILPDAVNAIQRLSSRCLAISDRNRAPCQTCNVCRSGMQIQAVLAATLNLYWRYKCIIIRRANETHDPVTSKLPNELVVIIFKFACDDDWDGPLTLGAVCQQWRAIIYATPSFWTTIWLNVKLAFGSSYNPDSPMSRRNQRKLDLFRGWLARSGELPISLWLTLGKKNTGQANDIQRELRQDEVEREFGPFVALVNSYSSRFKFIDIEALQSMLLALGPAYEGPLLRRLKITALDGGHYYTPEKEDEDTEEEFTAIPRQAADGRNLELFLINHEFNNIDCQRLNVTDISAQYFETESLLRALRETPDVLECRMSYYIHTPLATAEPVTHLRLTSLSINDGLNQGLDILMEVCLPSLKVLKVHLPGQSDVVDNCILISEFIHISNCKLIELELFFANLQENEVEAIMAYLLWTRLLHDLEEFTLLKLDFNPDSLFDVLSRSSLNGIHSAYAKEDGNCKYDHVNPQEVDPDTMVFLPSLKSFTYSLTTSDLRDTIPWNTLVDSFGPLPNAQRRPLTSVKIIPEWKLGNLKTTKPLLDSLSLSPDSVKNLITAIQAGCHIMLPAEIEEDDLAEV